MALDTKKHIHYTRSALIDIDDCLHSSDSGVIAALKVHELLSKIHDILDNAVSKQVGNTTCICTSQFLFLYSVKDSISPSEACLYIFIKCLLAQMHKQTCLDLSQSSTCVRSARAKPKDRFQFSVQKWPVPESGGSFLVKKPHLDTRLYDHQG